MSSRHVPNDCVSLQPTLPARNALQPLHIPFIKEGFHSPPNVIRSTVDRGLLPSFDQPRGVSLLIGSKSVYCLSCLTLLLIQINRYTNVQELRLQEAQEESTSHAGRTPRQLEVELTDELIDSYSSLTDNSDHNKVRIRTISNELLCSNKCKALFEIDVRSASGFCAVRGFCAHWGTLWKLLAAFGSLSRAIVASK